MKPKHYTFVTTWRIQAPLKQVWMPVAHVESWPSWWRGVKNVRVIRLVEKNNGVGTKVESTWKSWLPYHINFTIEVVDVDLGRKLVVAAQGDLNGTGTWEVHEENGITIATYTWSVATAKWWMNLISPIARPVFAHAHDRIMSWGEQGLVKLLQNR